MKKMTPGLLCSEFSLSCVVLFVLFLMPQEKYKKSQANVFTKLPIGSAQIQSASPSQLERDVSKEPQKLSCSQCNCNITFKPELVQIKVRWGGV